MDGNATAETGMSTDRPTTKLGYDEYVLFPNDGKRHEVINGDHFRNPAPGTYHQTISKRLFLALCAGIESRNFGEVFFAPCDVQLGEHVIVQPDLIVVLNDSAARITPSRVIGAPDMLIEVLSPSTAQNDRTLKKAVYERSGVREYWVVDPDEHAVTQLVAEKGKFAEREHGDTIQLDLVPDLSVSLDSIW